MQNVAYSVFTRAQGAVFTYVTTYLLLRALDVEGYGLYTVLFIGTMNTLQMVGRLGIPNLLSRFVPEYFAQGRWRQVARLFRATTLVQTGVSAVLLVAAYIFAPHICVWINYPGQATLLRVFALGAFSFLLADNYRVLLGGMFLHDAIFWRNLIYNVLRLGAILIAVRQPDPLLAVLIAEAVMAALSLGLFALTYRKVMSPRIAADPHPPAEPPWPRYRRYTGLSYVNELGVMLLNSATDLFSWPVFWAARRWGYMGWRVALCSWFTMCCPATFFSAVITPLFFSEYGTSRENARFGFTLLVKIGLLVTIPMGIWLALMSRPLIVELFDPRYADAARILGLMGLFLPLETLRYPLGLSALNAERNDLLIYSKVFSVLKILVGLWWLSHGGGVLAMVFVTAAAMARAEPVSLLLDRHAAAFGHGS